MMHPRKRSKFVFALEIFSVLLDANIFIRNSRQSIMYQIKGNRVIATNSSCSNQKSPHPNSASKPEGFILFLGEFSKLG